MVFFYCFYFYCGGPGLVWRLIFHIKESVRERAKQFFSTRRRTLLARHKKSRSLLSRLWLLNIFSVNRILIFRLQFQPLPGGLPQFASWP